MNSSPTLAVFPSTSPDHQPRTLLTAAKASSGDLSTLKVVVKLVLCMTTPESLALSLMSLVFSVNNRQHRLTYNAHMPAHPKVTGGQIVEAARKLLEANGRDGFSMNDVAAAVGVQTPSLYGHFSDRAALLEAVEVSLREELGKAL